MKKNILIIISLVAISSTCFNGLSVAQDSGIKSSISSSKPTPEEVQTTEYKYMVKDYDKELLNSLVAVENDLQNDNIKGTKDESDDILGFLTYYKKEAQRSKDISESLNPNYKSYRVLELKYGTIPNDKVILVPVDDKSGLNADSLKGRSMLLYYFKNNKINSATIRYITCNVGSEQLRLDLRKLLSGIEESNVDYIHESMKDIYNDVLIYHDNKIPIITKILDNLVVIKYLIDNDQKDAARNAIVNVNSQMSKLIDTNSSYPERQQKIRDLQKSFSDVSKVSDANYIAEWQKVADDITK